MFLAGRVLAAFLQDQNVVRDGSDAWVIPVLGLAAAVVLGNLISAPAHQKTGWGLLALGLILGPVFPTLVSMVLKFGPSPGTTYEMPGTAYGVMFAIGSLGGVILGHLMGLDR